MTLIERVLETESIKQSIWFARSATCPTYYALLYDMTTARTTYTAGTPDRPTFFPAPEDDPRPQHVATPVDVLDDASFFGRADSWEFWRGLKRKSQVFMDRSREICMNNTGMLLIAASQASSETKLVCLS